MTIDNSAQSDYVKSLTFRKLSWTGDSATSAVIKYSFDSALNYKGFSPTDLDGTQQAAVRLAMDYWEKVAGVTFQEDNGAPGIVFGALSTGNQGITYRQTSGTYTLNRADVYIDPAITDFGAGELGLFTFVHEIGHALGLDDDGANPTFDDDVTAMSYNPGQYADQTPYPSRPMLYDIAAAQFLYGVAQDSVNAGDTDHVYDGTEGEVITVWDHSGTQTLTNSNNAYNAVLDLRTGLDASGNPYASTIGSTTVILAFGSNFQNAVGANGDDTITGNGDSNSIEGGAGNDVLTPGAGDDTIVTGADQDTVVFEFNATDDDTVTDFSLGDDALDFSALGVTAYNLQADATEVSGTTTLHINGMDIIITGVTKTDLFNPSNNAFIGLIGGTAGNAVDGTGSADNITGAYTDGNGDTITANNDTLTGNGGNDTLNGGAGNDTYVFAKGAGSDTISESYGTEKNILQMTNVSFAELFLNCATYPHTALVATVNDGSAQGSVAITSQFSNAASSQYVLRYLQLTDRVLDLAGPLVYSAPGTSGATVIAQQAVALADTVRGTTGNDGITGNAGNNTLEAFAGADYLTGNAGADTLTGGTGDDTLVGGTGNDKYYFSKGDGNDRLEETQESGSENTLYLTSINRADVYLSSYYENSVAGLLVTINDGSARGSVKIHQQWYNTPGTNGYMIKMIEAADGSIDLSTTSGLTYRTLPTTGGTAMARPDLGMNNTVLGGTGNDYLYGGPGGDSISGSGGADYLVGNAGADTLTGGTGDDTLVGGTGNDKYYFSKGDGNDRLEETQESGSENTLYLTSINRADVYLSSYYENGVAGLLVTVNDGSAQGSVKIHQQWYNTPGTNGYMIKMIEAADGTIDLSTTSGLTYRTLPTTGGTAMARPDLGMNNTVLGGTGNDYLYGGPGGDSISGSGGADYLVGNAGADTLIGGTGDDTLVGGTGNDKYYFSKGDGNDRLEETQESGSENTLYLTSINRADVYLSSYYENGTAGLLVTVNDGSAQGSVKIHQQWYNMPGTHGFMVKTIETADETIDLTTTSGLTYSTLPTTGGTAMARPDLGMNNTVLGGTGNDYLTGGPGADSISGSGGADSLTGNAGADTLIGGTGDDTLVGGDGDDTYSVGTSDGHDYLYDYSGNNTLDIGAYDHISNSGNDRTYYFDNTNTHWVFIDEFAVNSWSVI